MQSYCAIDKCPLANECNEKNYKTWKVWGETEADAQDRLWKHLTECGLHTGQRADMDVADKHAFYTDLVMNAPITYYKYDEDDKSWVAMGNASKGKAQGKGKAREQGMQGTASKAASAGSVGHAQPPPHAPPDHMVGPSVKRRKLLKDMRITLENCARGAERVADIAAEFSEACREEAVNFRDASEALKEMEREL